MKTLARDLVSNLASLLLAFSLAVIIWFRASQLQDPLDSQFLQLPIQVIGQPADSTLRRSSAQSVQIFLEGPSSALQALNSDELIATIDLSQVPFQTETAVNVDIPQLANVTVLSQSPRQVTVFLEESITRAIPVKLDLRGVVARGHTQGEPLLEPANITVTGPASVVETLDFARVTFFLNNDRTTVSNSPQPIFYDKQGLVVSVRDLELSDELVKVTIPINESAGFAEKPVTVDWVGEPADGYRLLNVSVDPSSVLVQGRPTQLSLLTRLKTEPIDITGLTASVTQQVSLELPNGITVDQNQPIYVTVEIGPILTTSSYKRAVNLQGLSPGLEATALTTEVQVVLYGPVATLNAIQDDEVRVSVDLFGLVPGRYTLQPKVDFPDRGIEFRSLQPSTVTIAITNTVTPTVTGTETAVPLATPKPVVTPQSFRPFPATSDLALLRPHLFIRGYSGVSIHTIY